MNLTQFIEKYKDGITRRVVESYPPLYRPSDEAEELPRLLRRPMGGQTDAIRGAALSLRESPAAIVVGEMGTGKTFVGTAAAYMAGFERVLVLCPPHLTTKWQREIEQTIPYVHAVIVNSITDLERVREYPYKRPVFVIMSREKAKLSYRWKPVYKTVVLQDRELSLEVPACVDCGKVPANKDKVPLKAKDLEKRKLFCVHCGGAFWSADKAGPRRYPLADYIKKYMRDYFDLFIGDEVHEYKGRGSAQGIAAGILAECADKSMTLTGTLTGGYSSTLFHLLYRFSPDIRLDFEHSDESRWVQRYGFLEKVINYSEEAESGKASKRRGYRTSTKEKPGITPASLFHLIGNSVFLRLSDVASGLPSYEEQVITMGMSDEPDETGWSQKRAYGTIYQKLYDALIEALAKGSGRLLSIYLQTLLAYPDGCTRGEDVWNPEEKEWIIRVPPLSEEVIYPKEEALIDLVRAERKKGRKVLVYVTHTGTRDITGRIRDLLEAEGFQSSVLKADTVAPDKREAWVQERLSKGCEVLICHPRLVQTGLDLIEFPTICWYETDYSVYTMRQASRRSWRIGQTEPVRVIFMCYEGALQSDALVLVSRKLQSSLAVEGELPEEGLAGYADDGDDLMMALAKRLVSMDEGAETLDQVFAQRFAAETEDEAILVTPDWYKVIPEPEPVTVVFSATPAPEPEMDIRDLQLWAQEMSTKRKKEEVQMASLFDWAMSR